MKHSGAVRTFHTVRNMSYGPLTSYGPNPSYTNFNKAESNNDLDIIHFNRYFIMKSTVTMKKKTNNSKISFYKSFWDIRTGQQF